MFLGAAAAVAPVADPLLDHLAVAAAAVVVAVVPYRQVIGQGNLLPAMALIQAQLLILVLDLIPIRQINPPIALLFNNFSMILISSFSY